MANKRTPMKKIIDIARYIEKGLNNSEIHRIVKVSRKKIKDYREKLAVTNTTFEIIKNLDDDQAYKRLFGKEDTRVDLERYGSLDLEHIKNELRKKSVTLQLLWEEYIQGNPTGYQYTQFCKHFRDYERKLNYSFRNHFKWGETYLVDYAGQTVPIFDPSTGESKPAYIFVGTLGASNYTYAEATHGKTTKDWIQCHCNSFEYFGGTPEIVVPDNDTALVNKAHRYEPVINENYKDMADHYDVCILPTRVRKPRDKAKVEGAVLIVERWILACIRNRKYFSIDELNEDIWDLLEILNGKPFKKMKGSRCSLFEEFEKPLLKQLPKNRYDYFERTTASVYLDYHIKVKDFYYSVPCSLVGEKVNIHIRPMTVTIFHKNKQIYCHLRSYTGNKYITVDDHMPKSHREYKKWTPDRILNWAGSIDENVMLVIKKIFSRYRHPALGFRSAMGIISLSKKYPIERLSKACKKANNFMSPTFKVIEGILKEKTEDQQVCGGYSSQPLTQDHENMRGSDYYDN